MVLGSSMSADNYLIVKVHKSYFALPVSNIVGLVVSSDLCVVSLPICAPETRGLVSIRDELYLDLDFATTLGLYSASSKREFSVLVKTTHGLYCLDVDLALDVVQLPDTVLMAIPISGKLRNALKGMFKLPDGSGSGLCLDIAQLLSQFKAKT